MQSAADALATMLGSPFDVLQWSVLGMWGVAVVTIATHVFVNRPHGAIRISLASGIAFIGGGVLMIEMPILVVAGGVIAVSLFLGLAVGVSVSINERLITTPF